MWIKKKALQRYLMLVGQFNESEICKRWYFCPVYLDY